MLFMRYCDIFVTTIMYSYIRFYRQSNKDAICNTIAVEPLPIQKRLKTGIHNPRKKEAESREPHPQITSIPEH